MAQALAALAPIHAMDPDTARPVEIEPAALAQGRFQRGASVLLLPDGTQRWNLRIQRRHLEAAISILQSNG